MKALLVVAVAGGVLSFLQGVSGQNQTVTARSSAPKAPGTCGGCTQRTTIEDFTTRTVPGTSETVLIGRIENLIPIAVLTSLGCEKCAAEAVAWALQQGSSTEDVDRALRAVAQMQTLDCFKQQFGPDAPARLEKPLAAARKALQEATNGGLEQ
jgi:hypothetical protein